MPTLPKLKRPHWLGERKPFERYANKNTEIYNSPRWRRVSYLFKLKHPICCRPGCGQPTHTTNHVIPINQGGAVWDEGNWEPLCETCNARETGRMGNKRAGNSSEGATPGGIES